MSTQFSRHVEQIGGWPKYLFAHIILAGVWTIPFCSLYLLNLRRRGGHGGASFRCLTCRLSKALVYWGDAQPKDMRIHTCVCA